MRCVKIATNEERFKSNNLQQPDKFIQVLIALATAAPENLGYDPTMKVFTDYSRSVSIPSYLRNYDSTDMSPDEKNVYLMQWIMEVTADDKVFPYVTLRALSAIGAEVMCGRATIIWEAVKLEDMNSLKEVSLNSRHHYRNILKSNYRPQRYT